MRHPLLLKLQKFFVRFRSNTSDINLLRTHVTCHPKNETSNRTDLVETGRMVGIIVNTRKEPAHYPELSVVTADMNIKVLQVIN